MFQIKDYILEINKTRNFSQAAANLYISQPSLSMSIKRLENEIGEPLFDRSTHPIQLTEVGKEYVRVALEIKRAEDSFNSFIDDYRGIHRGTITIGGSNMNISYVLPPLLKHFNQKYPSIDVKIIEGNIQDTQKKLLDGEIDLLLDSGSIDARLFSEYIYNRENLILMIPKNIPCRPEVKPYRLTYDDIMTIKHTDESIQPLPLNLLDDIPFIFMTPDTDTYIKAQELCEIYSYKPNIKMSFSQQSTAFHVSCWGVGAAFISDELLRNAKVKPDAFFFKVLPQIGTRYIKLYAKKERRISYAMEKLIEIAAETGSKFTNA